MATFSYLDIRFIFKQEFLNSHHYIVIKNRCDTNMEEVIESINVLSLFSLIIILPFKTSEKHGKW